MRSLKNTALATILASTLTACGGGGGGGPAGDINNCLLYTSDAADES